MSENTNTNPISLATTTALTVSNLILATPDQEYGYMPQDGDDVNIKDGFLFDFEADQVSNLKSQITDHATETNSNVADNIALSPETYITTGFISELNDIVPRKLRPVKVALTKLWVLNGLFPELSESAQQAYNLAFQGYQALENAQRAINAVSEWGSNDEFGGLAQIGGNGIITGDSFNNVTRIRKTQSKQQVAYQKLYAYWQNRTAFTIQTPWAIMKNMYIEEVQAKQGAESKSNTEFTVSFKMIRFAETAQSSYKPNSNTFASQIAPPVDSGELSFGLDLNFRSGF